ncbi:MAG: exosortase/archaeosortase family protein [Gemmatimonadota bacterium]
MLPLAVAGLLFAMLFAQPARLLALDWWNDPDAGHGLLLAPLAVWLAWRRGFVAQARPNVVLGAVLLLGSVLLRYLSGLAAELFTMRLSMVGATIGLTVFFCGLRQVVAWWLPFSLLILSIPVPDLIMSSLALPLQLKASAMGAALLEWRDVPVRLSGNVIQLPGRQLFVTEACSGLRSLTALLSLGLLIGGLWLRSPWSRVLLVAVSLPVAIAVNAVRVFLTGFLVFFVDPALGEGFMHLTEGWLLFIVAFLILGATSWVIGHIERRMLPKETASNA